MTNLGEAYVEVRADTSKFGPDLDKAVTKPLKEAEQQAKKLGDELKGGLDKGKIGAKDFQKAAMPAGLALGAVAGAFGLFAKQAEEAEIAQRRLTQVLTTMGYGEATGRVSAYADELERTVAVDGEVIKATQTKLATFANLTKSVGESGGAFDRATVAALDLAAAGFGSAETNAVQLGKALQDPVKGISALGRAGVTFTAQEKEKIKTLVESGNVLAAQDVILKAVEGQVGGTAEASKSAFAEIKIAVENAGESIGAVLLPIIQKVATVFSGFARFVADNTGVFIALGVAIGIIAGAVVAINTAFRIYYGIQLAIVKAQWLWNAALNANPIGLIVIGIAAVIAILVIAYKRFEGFRNVVNTVVNAVIGYFEFMTNVWIKAINGFISGINKFTGIFSKVGINIGKIGEIGEVTFGRLGEASDKAAGSAADFRKADQESMDAYNKNKQDATTETNTFTGAVDKAGDAAKKAAEKIKGLREDLGKGFEKALTTATEVLNKARGEFDKFAGSVADSITGALNFKDAYTAGTETGSGFVSALTAQAAKIKTFSELTNRLLTMGLSEAALQQVLAAGVDSGTAIANELIRGGQDAITGPNGINALTASVQSAANTLGLNAAGQFRQAGVDTGQALVDGINSVISKYKVSLKSKKLTAKQLKKLQKDFAIDVQLAFSGAGAETPELANGGIFTGRQNAVIGEAGAEAVIPITRPARALSLLEQSGLASLVRSSDGSRGAALNIEQATFMAPVDADLVAQRVMAAERARTFGS